jgi:hypothetical protein
MGFCEVVFQRVGAFARALPPSAISGSLRSIRRFSRFAPAIPSAIRFCSKVRRGDAFVIFAETSGAMGNYANFARFDVGDFGNKCLRDLNGRKRRMGFRECSVVFDGKNGFWNGIQDFNGIGRRSTDRIEVDVAVG